MSLFDVLRYGNVDLSIEAELSELPEELIKLYWKNANRSIQSDWNIKYSSHDVMCHGLASPWVNKSEKKFIYVETLKEYSNESL